MKVFKYPLINIDDHILVQMPEGAKVLTIQIQKKIPCIWALVNPELPLENRFFRWVGTGHEINEFSEQLKYINTFQMCEGDLVFHLFEIIQ